MPVTYPATVPTSGVTTIDWNVMTSSLISRSPFSLKGQSQDWGGSLRTASVTIDGLNRQDAEDWAGFLDSLRGTKGTFLFGDPMAASPMGVGGGSPKVSANNLKSDLLTINGGPNSTSNYLRRGDWLQVGTGLNSRLYKVMASVATSSTGTASIRLHRELVISPASGDTVTINSPKGLFRRSTGNYSYSQYGCNYSISFDCEEVL